jgi:hypothetical protein
MPATAHQPDSEGETSLAPVVSLAGRRGAKASMTDSVVPTDAPDVELQEQASRHWASVFGAAGLELSSPKTGAVVTLVTKELERLVGGLLVIREGRGDSLPANPDAGVDLTSAVEISSVLRDLAHAAATAQTQPR